LPEELVDPVVLPSKGSVVAAAGLPRLSGQPIAMLNNRKPGGEELLLRLGSRLEQRLGARMEFLSKPDTSIAPDPIFRDLSARFRGIVTGLGD
jgi:hypothetical protein